MLRTVAPAKINLSLQITARRADGLHTLESLVVFSAFGDAIEFAFSNQGDLVVCEVAGGDEKMHALLGAENSVVKAFKAFRPFVSTISSMRARLEKHIPIAAGLGGGSCDAAATIRTLMDVGGLNLAEEKMEALVLGLGADVPVCLYGRPALVSGIGESLTPAPPLPFPVPLVLAHTGEALSTASVFSELKSNEFSASVPARPTGWSGLSGLVEYLKAGRNDLQAPACRLQPKIGDLLAALKAQPGCLLARMSGSGAACFGLFESGPAAQAAEADLRAKSWWANATDLWRGADQ